MPPALLTCFHVRPTFFARKHSSVAAEGPSTPSCAKPAHDGGPSGCAPHSSSLLVTTSHYLVLLFRSPDQQISRSFFVSSVFLCVLCGQLWFSFVSLRVLCG